jgi:WD40 repeat protein
MPVSKKASMADSNDYSFDVFISYATNPDYSLARKLESFLETFNSLPTPENLSLTPLRICVDGSDFHTGTKSSAGSDVKSTIESYLANSKELLVLCSRNARKSVWVDQEIRWFLTNRGPHSIRVALTEAEDLSKLDEVFPQAILETGLHERIAYDFRGVHKRTRKKSQAVRDFDDERTRLAADLYGRPASEIRPIWFREQRRQARNRTRIFIIVSVVLLALLAGAIYFYFAAEAERKRTLAESERTRRQFYVASMNLAQRALNEGSVPLARQLLEAQQPREGQEDFRDFDWSYLLRRTKAEKSHLFVKDVAFESISVSADASLVAAGGRLWTVKNGDEDSSYFVYVWSLQREKLKYVLKGHNDSITVVKFSPVAPVLASGSQDGTLKIWNAESGTEIRSVELGSVDALSYSPDGSILAVSDGVFINLFNTTTWESTGRFAIYLEQAPVRAITFSPHGKFLAVGGRSKKVSLWDVAKRKMIEVVGEHKDAVFAAAWSPESNLLATGGADGVVILWDMNKKNAPVRLPQDEGVDSLAFTRDGKLLAVGSGNPLELESGKTIVLWNVATATRCGLLKGHPRRVESLDFTPSGDSLISVGEEETIRIWDVQTASFMAYFRSHRLPVWALSYSPDGKMIASGDGEGTIQLRNLESGVSVELKGHEDRVVDLSFDPSSRLVASAGRDGTLRLWQTASQSDSQMLLKAGPLMTAVAFAPDGSKLAATNCEGNIYLWDAPDFKSLPSLKQTGCPSFLAWSPDSQHFLTGGGDPANKDSPKSVFLWRVGVPTPIKVLDGHSSWPTNAAFSPDGTQLVTGSWDGELILWDLASGMARHTMRGHTDIVTAVRFSPSGRIIASSSRDKSLRFWDTVTGQERAVLTDSGQAFFAMTFHPSGQILAAAGSDGVIVQWIADQSPLTKFSPQQ